MKKSSKRQQLSSQQRRQWQSTKPKNRELYTENTLSQLRKQSHCSLSLPFLLLLFHIILELLSFPGRAITGHTEGWRVPGTRTGSCFLQGTERLFSNSQRGWHCWNHCWGCRDLGRSAASLPTKENSFGKTRVTSNHQAGNPHGKITSLRVFSITVLSFIFFLWLGLNEHPFSFPLCQCLVLSHPVPLHPYPPILQNPLLPKSGFISSPTSPTTRSPLPSYSQWRVLCSPADLDSSLPLWAKNHSEQWHFKLCREGR